MIVLLLAGVTNVDYPRPPMISPLRPSQMTGPFRYGYDSKDAGATARLLLTVDPTGRIIHCDVVVPSGHPKLDTAGCKLYLGIKGQPALGGDGKPAYGTISAGVTFFKDGGLIPPSVDLQLVVERLPDPGAVFARRFSSLIVDPTGKVLTCSNILYGRASPDALDRALCKFAATSVTFKPVLDVANRPTESVQAFAVEFSTKDAPVVRPGPPLRPE
ncbi:hypothetical protein C8J43_10275 [Sphingomonas sp. PP-CE-1G-424]|nr:hypothetical protein C8J43_10275 [Sphingomonas sp. PP-CE-1G-424]